MSWFPTVQMTRRSRGRGLVAGLAVAASAALAVGPAAASASAAAQPPSAGTPAGSALGRVVDAITAGVARITDEMHCAANTAAQEVVVDISAQHAWFCAQRQLVNDTPVTTGRLTDGLQTRPGTWTIQGKQTDRTLTGPGYSRFVHFWMPYDGDFGFHDATWQLFPFGGPQWRTDGSAGCVHLPLPVMAWFYGWSQDGTRVSITA